MIVGDKKVMDYCCLCGSKNTIRSCSVKHKKWFFSVFDSNILTPEEFNKRYEEKRGV